MNMVWRAFALAAALVLPLASGKAEPTVGYLLDFTDYDQGAVKSWLETKGFAFKADSDDRRKVDLDVGDRGLIIENKRNARTLLVNERANVADFRRIRITWKVDKYPLGANYDAGVRNEAIMVMVFFGHDKLSSGSFMIPDSPYFIGLFLCGTGAVGTAYTGRYFKKGGRYICLDNPEAGRVITSEYDLKAAFKTFFGTDAVPVISGLALQADTTNSKKGGKSQASIISVEIFEND